jgi:intraflagellar transport protein 20
MAGIAGLGGEVSVSFDSEGRIRVLDESRAKATGSLRDETAGYATKVIDFTEAVQTFVGVLDAQAKVIEKEKLRAIGQRNLVDREVDSRKHKKAQQLTLIREREAELERLLQQAQSLEKVEAEQLALIEKLSNNEA